VTQCVHAYFYIAFRDEITMIPFKLFLAMPEQQLIRQKTAKTSAAVKHHKNQ
jgi:hypothetical protein